MKLNGLTNMSSKPTYIGIFSDAIRTGIVRVAGVWASLNSRLVAHLKSVVVMND